MSTNEITLNDAQHAAVTAPDGPALVLAGAGSGKTRVIVERLVWLADERGVDPRRMLALTFTNRAAAEMRERFAARLGVDRVAAWLGTFHSFGLYVLRRDIDKLERPKHFSIFDDSDQKTLMKRLVKELPPTAEKVSPREALWWISNLKQAVEQPKFQEEPDDAVEETFRLLWQRYHAALHQAAAVDFDDLLVLTVKLFEQHSEVLEKYQERFQHVLIDEYQDTNRAQYEIARLLSEESGNIFAVGDEDQSIYSWRGADITNILDFSEDFPGANVYRLEENYRSTAPILEAANAVVKNNQDRLGKTLWTRQKQGDPVRLYIAESGNDEAKWIVDDMAKRGLAPADVAVLYRTNAQSRLIEEALRLKGLHYIVIGGIKFYSRKEIKDLLAYLRLLVNPADDEALRRIVNVPARGIGGTTMQRIEDYATARHEPLFSVLREIEDDETIPARGRQSCFAFVELIDDLAMAAKEDPVAEVVEQLLDKTGYRKFVEESDEKDFRARLEIVDEFVTACEQHDATQGGGLLEFLQDLALVSDADDWNPDEPAVTLMTCHSAKGLEFDYIYLAGLEEGLLPLVSEFEDEDKIEEERRLCYVAMTRARKGLTLTAAESRRIYGKLRPDRELSRFIHEIGLDKLDQAREAPAAQKAAPKTESPAVKSGELKTGTRVRHAKFGPGTVLFTQGSGNKLKAKIRFKTGRSATIMVSAAPLEILKGDNK